MLVDRLRVGIDLDNTLARYDHLFDAVAKEWKMLPVDFEGGKRQIRDMVRQLCDGDRHWMELQAEVYGTRMSEAALMDGVADFLRVCRRYRADVAIVSHKTRYAAADPDGVDLHRASLSWMEGQGFFDPQIFALNRDQVFFEPSREAKCRRIAALGCSHFVDDLEEVFREPTFPVDVERLLLDICETRPEGPFTVCPTWRAIRDAIFPDL